MSASFDQDATEITRFRKDTWPMPWLHTLVKDGFQSRIASDFEVMSIPKPILVGRDGKILAIEDNLRGEQLDKTLAKFFSR